MKFELSIAIVIAFSVFSQISTQENPENAPLILWTGELPGFSCIKAIFLQTGPFQVGPDNVVKERNTTWTRSQSMLYMDAPAGTGFSFSDSKDKGEMNSGEVGVAMVAALKQFFTLFKEFQTRDLYLAGDNYAANVISNIVKNIEAENAKGDPKINVKGFILGSPFIDVQQLHHAQALYDFGLIDMNQKKIMDDTIQKAFDLAQNGKLEEATQIGLSTFIGPNSLIAKFTGFEDYFNALVSKPPPEYEWFQNFIETKEFHNYVHVGLHKYIAFNFDVLDRFSTELIFSHTKIFEEMLNKGYRVLFYAGQFDIFTSQQVIVKVVNNLKWNGSENFSKAPRKIWKVNGDVAGYVKTADNFGYAVVRKAGHYVNMDQPAWMLDLVTKFLYNKEF
ncbi:unnamed protein product [Allacma fusca]|uniref:Serine carboxypeptidase n=1 Tax=Allacma fusca TaxID=39272 RepID=A0A8J2PFF1_9HEXA|nr:unnamed protein product [Allacma fusca]